MIAPTCFGPPGPSSGSLCRTLQNYNFVELVSKNTSSYDNVFLLIPQNCNFSKIRHRLPYDDPGGPKHVGAIMS